MSGGLYGAIFSQSQQHFGGLFGYGPANKMLNELLGRQVKQAQDASDPDSISMLSSIEAANAADNSNTPTSKHGFESTTNLNNNNSSTTNNNNSASNNSPTSDAGSVMMGRRSSNSQCNTANNSGAGNNQQNNSNSNSSSGVIDLDGGSRTPQPNDLAHHMLRNILQGKKELMALDHELRTVSNQSSALGDRISPDNNNVISKNNNIYDISKCETVNGGDVSDSSELGANNNKVNQKNSATNNQTNNSDNINQSTRPISLDSNNSNCDDMLASDLAHTERLLNGVSGSGNGTGSTGGRCSSVNPKQEKSDVIDELVASLPDEVDETMPSPASGSNGVIITKQELDMDDCLEDKDRDDRTPSPAPSKNDSESMTLKRARVENIVSSMRASPALLGSQQGQVNGCKKRKLYHPQQHDNSAAERYAAAAAAGLNLGLTLQNFMLGASADPDDDDDDMEVTPHLHQKRVEKDVLKSQLRSMQEQLAEMQQKYVQLCSRMEQQSDTQEVDDSASDIMEDDSNNPDLSPDKSLIQSSPASTPIKDMGKNADASSMLQMMSKMMSAKIHSQLPTHPHMPGGFNGTHLFLQHMQQQAGLPHDGMSQHSQMSNAAMYQKLFMEQEARMVKEVAEQQERNLQNSANQQLLQQQALQQQQMQQQQQHQERNSNNQQQMMQQQQQNQPPQPQLQSPQHQSNQSQQQQQQQQMQLQQQQQQQQMQQHQPPSQQNHISPPQMPPMPHLPQIPKGSSIPSDLTSRLNMMRSSVSSVGPMSGSDLEGLADVLKTEITASLSNLVDSIVTRFVHQRRFLGKQSEAAAAAAEQLNKDLMMASQLLDRSKSPRTKVSSERGPTSGNSSSSQSGNGPMLNTNLNSVPNPNQPPAGNPMIPGQQGNGPRLNGQAFPPMGMPMHVNNAPTHDPKTMNNMNQLNMPPHVRPSPSTAMFQTPKPPQNLNSVAAAALYNSMSALGNTQVNPFCMPEPRENPEQAEALSLVVTPKKKRHKVTDTRITPRTVSRILAQDGIIPSGNPIQLDQNNSNQGSNTASSNGSLNSVNNGNNNNSNNNNNNNNNSKNNNQQQFNSQPPSVQASTPTESPSPRGSFHPPPPSMLPVSLPTSVAIPNPSLHESQVFSPYSPFFNPHGPPHGGPHGPQPSQFHHMKVSSSPPGMNGMMDPRDSPPLPHPPTMLHPALLAAAHHGNSPDYGHIRASMDVNDRNSDCNSAELSYNGMEPTSSTLTPMHLRKAKLMFFWVRYPSSAVLKMYFPDIKFNKNNTAQLVKWFSNFREFYYIQMEKYARQSASEGMKNVDDIHVSNDSEIYRVLNLHYNRNNHIEVPQNFRYVVEQTLREFFRAIQGGKDTEQSWKKSIYKIISRLDDPVPEYFKTPNFLEQLE